MKRSTLRAHLLAMLAILIGITYPAMASEKEQLVKAAFLFNFTKFASWPEPLDIPSQSEISVCILGPNTLGEAKDVLEKGSSSALKINVSMLSGPPTEPGQCHIVYITTNGNLSALAAKSHQYGALTVSDADDFIDNGGIVGFVRESNKVRLHINRCNADKAGLKLDTQLLEIARRVKRECS